MWRVGNSGAVMLPKTGTVAHTKSSGAIEGPAIDRMPSDSQDGYNSGLLYGHLADSVGAPTAVALALKIQDSGDGSTDWTDVSGLTHTVSSESSASGTAVDLRGCRQYVRVHSTITHTGGTSPNSDYVSGLMLGGFVVAP